MTKFVVDLGNANVTDAQKSAIASAIHTAVLPHIAALPNPGGGKLMALSMFAGVCVVASPAEVQDAHDRVVAAATS